MKETINKEKINIEYIEKPEPPTLEEKMEHYFESGFLLRMCFGPPDSSILIQSIRGFICAVLLWSFIILFLNLFIVAINTFI